MNGYATIPWHLQVFKGLEALRNDVAVLIRLATPFSGPGGIEPAVFSEQGKGPVEEAPG